MKRFLITVSVLFLASCASQGSTSMPNEPKTVQYSAVISNYTYTPPQIDVQLGDRVVHRVTNQDDTTHAINLPEFGIQTSVGPGQTQTVEFTADRKVPPKPLCAHGETLFINVQP